MKGIAWVGISIGQMKVQRGSGNPTTNAFFILVASRYAYSTYVSVFFFFFRPFFFFFFGVLGFPSHVPAVQTRLFYEPGQPPGVYGALFRVASPPPPPVSQNKSFPRRRLKPNHNADDDDHDGDNDDHDDQTENNDPSM